MNIIVDLCTNAAAHHISLGKFLEAIPNLRAAMTFGGSESARINSIFVATHYSNLASAALARGDAIEASRAAGLSLAAHQNEAALITLAQLYLGRDPAKLEEVARQIAEIAEPDDPRGLRFNALIWRLDALQQLEPRDSALEEAIGRDALTSINQHLQAQPGAAPLLMARAMLYRRFGAIPQALEDLKQIQRADPHNVIVAAHCVDLASDFRIPGCAADLKIVAGSPDESLDALIQFYDLARRVGAKEFAAQFLARLSLISPDFKTLSEMKQTFGEAAPDACLGTSVDRSARSRIFLHAADEAATRALRDTLLPMLLAPGNIPALAATSSVTLDIIVPKSALKVLSSASILAKVSEHCRVELRGQAATARIFARRAAGMAFESAAGRARAEQAALMTLPSNALLADGSLSALPELARSQTAVLFFDPLEVEAAPLLGWLGRGPDSSERLVMKTSDLSEAVLRHLPPTAHRGIVDSSGAIETGMPRMIFGKTDGVSVRSLRCLPVYIAPGALSSLGDELCDPADGYVIDRVLASDVAEARVIGSASDFAMAIVGAFPGSEARVYPRNAAEVLIEQSRAAPSTLARTRLVASATRWKGSSPIGADLTSDESEAAMAASVANRLVAI